LRTVTSQLAMGFNGQVGNLHSLLDGGHKFLLAASANTAHVTGLINTSKTVLATQVDETAAIENFAASAELLAHQLVLSDSDLQRLISAAPAAANQVNGLLIDTNPSLAELIANLLTTSEVGGSRISAIDELLSGVPPALADVSSALTARGLDVATNLAKELQLPLPDLPWHSQRDRMGEIATTLGLCSGTLGKIARDISLHTQTEVGEVFEPSSDGRGGSSTMPHKRNPVTCAVVLSAAARVPPLVSTMLAALVQEQERGLGGWHAEWETLPDIVRLTAGALHHLTTTASELEIDPERMRQNLELTHGLIFAEAVAMALAEKMPRSEAHELLHLACKRAQSERRDLRSILAQDAIVKANLSDAEMDRLFTPANYLGVADQFIDRVLASTAAHRNRKRLRKK